MQLRVLTGGLALRLTRTGLELLSERPIHCDNDVLGRRVPADPALVGVLAFHDGASMFELMQLAERIEWPDETQPRRLRVRWRDARSSSAGYRTSSGTASRQWRNAANARLQPRPHCTREL